MDTRDRLLMRATEALLRRDLVLYNQIQDEIAALDKRDEKKRNWDNKGKEQAQPTKN